MSEYWYTSSDLGTSALSDIYAFEKFSSNALVSFEFTNLNNHANIQYAPVTQRITCSSAKPEVTSSMSVGACPELVERLIWLRHWSSHIDLFVACYR